MDFEVVWARFALKKLFKIFEFYKLKASIRVAENITTGIENATEILKHFPLKGEKEELLINHKKEFRHLIYKNYKIIYWQNEKKNRIEIVNVFDTRQNPTKIKKLK